MFQEYRELSSHGGWAETGPAQQDDPAVTRKGLECAAGPTRLPGLGEPATHALVDAPPAAAMGQAASAPLDHGSAMFIATRQVS